MKSVSALVAVLVAAQAAIAQQFTINTPTGVTSCQPTRFTWIGGTGPYILQLTEGTTTGGAVIKEFDNIGASETGFTWNVDVAGGTNFIANLKDNTGTIAQSAAVAVGNGSTACVNSTVTETASGQTSAPVSTGAPTQSAPAGQSTTSSGTATGTSPAGTSTGGSSTGASSQTGKPSATTGGAASQSSGASQQLTAGALGFTGLIGAIGAMLF